MTDDKRTRNLVRRNAQGVYTYFAKFPTIFKFMAYLTLAAGGLFVLFALFAMSRGLGHPIFAIQILLALVYCIVSFFLFMGLSEWAKVAMETHVNTLLIGQHLREGRAPGQQPQEPE